MTILFFSRLFYPHIGGVEKHVMETGKRLVKMGHTVIVVTEYSEKGSKSREVVNGITIYRISAGPHNRLKKFRIWGEIWKLRNLIRDADIVHCHDVFFWYLPFRLLFPGKHVYTTFHGYEGYPIPKKTILIRKISEKLSRGNICIGDFIKKWYGTQPSFVSYGAVDSANGKWQMANGKWHSAVFIGRLDEQTGILTYAKAVEIVKKHVPGFDFLIVGDGRYKNRVSKIGKTIGFKSNPEKYFRRYHFAFVSRYLSILEALAARRLVFAVYDNPLKEDYLKMAPFAKFIVIAGDEIALSEKIAYYIKQSNEERKLIKEGYQWAGQQTWEKLVDTYLTLWRK